jgi:transcriptional regulator with XRE-family HTH domain
MEARAATLGDQLRGWRQLRRMSQLDLALEAEISARHLSFVETGRSQPSREMILRLAERLAVPLRGRNALLLAAGLAPAYRERSFDDPELQQARAAIEQILGAHEPYPALAVDRHWTMLAHNGAVPPLLGGVAPHLLEPPVNVLRLSLHPEGLARRIVNLGEWKSHLLERLRGQFAASADPVLGQLAGELEGYPAPHFRAAADDHAGLFIPLVLDAGGARLSFFSTTTMFGTPVDITLSEIAVEAFFPADPATAEALRGATKG